MRTLDAPAPKGQAAIPDAVAAGAAAPLADLFRAFGSAGLEWCLLRGDPEAIVPGGDVDLLVARSHRPLARHLAIAHGFAHLTTLGRGSHAFYVAYDHASDRWIKLDIVHDLRFGPYQTLRWNVAKECLARRQRVGDIFVLAPSDAFWTLLLHCLLDKGRIAPRHREPLRRLAAVGAISDPIVAALPRGGHAAGWDAASVIRNVGEGQWADVERLAPLVSRSFRRTQPLRAMVRGAANRGLRRLTRATLVWHRGFSVALMGPDGAGKSTLAAALQERFFLPVRIVYMGIHRASTGPQRRAMALPTRLLTNWARCAAAQLHRARGRLVVFDRFPFDALLPSARPIGPSRRAGRWLVAHVCRRPDVVVLLDAPADVMHRRKADHPIEVLEARRQQYLRLASRLRGAHVVDANRPPEELRRRVTAVIWESYRRRRHGPRRPKKAAVR
jgi:thymidylate kinase